MVHMLGGGGLGAFDGRGFLAADEVPGLVQPLPLPGLGVNGGLGVVPEPLVQRVALFAKACLSSWY